MLAEVGVKIPRKGVHVHRNTYLEKIPLNSFRLMIFYVMTLTAGRCPLNVKLVDRISKIRVFDKN